MRRVAKLMVISYHHVVIQQLAMEKLAIPSILSEILNFYEKTEEIPEYVLIMENNMYGFKMTHQLFITIGSFTSLLTSEDSACMHYIKPVRCGLWHFLLVVGGVCVVVVLVVVLSGFCSCFFFFSFLKGRSK